MRSYTLALPLLAEADAEARALGHSYIGPEHLLLALAATGDGVCEAFLGRHRMTVEGLRDAVVALLGPERVSTRESGGPLAITHRSVVALAHALAAGQRTHKWPEPYSPDELLGALLADDVAPGATVGAVLEDAGVTLAAARAELAMLQGRRPGT